MQKKLRVSIAVSALAVLAAACGHETTTIVRRQTVETVAPAPAPVVVERHTVIQQEPVVPQQRVYEERRTTVEEAQ